MTTPTDDAARKAWIENHASTILHFVEEDELSLRGKPDDFGLRLVAKNNRQYLSDLNTMRADLDEVIRNQNE
jgi:hypothetical protein